MNEPFVIRDLRLPDDRAACVSFIDGLQKYEHAFEPNRRVDAAVAEEYFTLLLKRVAAGVMVPTGLRLNPGSSGNSYEPVGRRPVKSHVSFNGDHPVPDSRLWAHGSRFPGHSDGRGRTRARLATIITASFMFVE